MNITVVICTHNRSALLRSTLASLARARRPTQGRADILVAANACSDDTHALLAETECDPIWHGLPLRWIQVPTPGKSFALNSAIASASAESAAICFIDDDQLVDAGFLQALAQALDDHPDHGIVCGKMHPAWDGSEPAWVHETGQYHIPIRPFPEYDFGDLPKEITAGHKLPSGGNITVRRQVFQVAGLFSTDLGPQGHNLMGGEDLEFLMRCLNRGQRLIYVPTLRQLHAIERERMRTLYMMRKSYLRSLSSQRMADSPSPRVRPYMLLKPLRYCLNATFTADATRRFYFLIRMAAALGELRAAIEN